MAFSAKIAAAPTVTLRGHGPQVCPLKRCPGVASVLCCWHVSLCWARQGPSFSLCITCVTVAVGAAVGCWRNGEFRVRPETPYKAHVPCALKRA